MSMSLRKSALRLGGFHVVGQSTVICNEFGIFVCVLLFSIIINQAELIAMLLHVKDESF